MNKLNATRIYYYCDPDGLAILIRQHGGKAYVETEQGRDVVITNRSLTWVRKVCKEKKRIFLAKFGAYFSTEDVPNDA